MRNHWRYATQILFQSEDLREEWEPGAVPIDERIQVLREAHAAGISSSVKIHPAAYPDQLINIVEPLRADVDEWKIGRPPAGECRRSRLPGDHPDSSTPTLPWPICAVWSKGA